MQRAIVVGRCFGAVRSRGRLSGPRAFAAFVLGCGFALVPSLLRAQTADRVLATEGSVSGKIVAVSVNDVDVEDRNGETKKVTIDKIREVQFGDEPQSLRSARSMLGRGRPSEALAELEKIEASELDGAEKLILDERDFVRAAATGRAALLNGTDPAAAAKAVQEFLGKNPKSHHFYEMQELLGNLHARAGDSGKALAAYSQLSNGPAAFKIRSASAKAGMLFEQKKYDDAIKEFQVAAGIDATDEASAAQKRGAALGKASCLSQLGKNDEAVKLVQGIIKQANPEEKDLLARAYNVLGTAYRAAGDKDQDALISFVTVDLVYSGSPESHAEALSNLSELWEKVKNPERAREARKLLEESYPGSRWAKKAAAGGSS
jgi:tetratricopeptide (TPR) repeat protein